MLETDKIKKAYENAQFFKDFEINYQIDLRRSENVKEENIVKSLSNMNNIIKFWSKDYKYDTPVVIVAADENGYEFLKEQLTSLMFADAIPSPERWEINKRGIFGSGGYSIIDDKKVLLYWQVINSKAPFEHTGDYKTAPHLFTHAVQGVLTGQKFNLPGTFSLLTDFPGWFVEGQADFAALMAISENFDEYMHHRSNYFKYAFIPAQQNDRGENTSRMILKEKTEEGWTNSLKNSPLKFKGIPLSDEYYTGLLAYEEMMYHINHEEMMVFCERFTKGENFDDLFKEFIGINLQNFYEKLGKELFELAKGIYISSWPSWVNNTGGKQ